ncbi:MAG TPA: NAD(P)H-quinone dehydrogenase [Actinomycetota bacterium]|nr:NAD(P)H-quinone dehydrogenase [Actinomycetota bacterium]
MRIVIVGGGPAGYEAALVAAELGAHVTVVDRVGLGGACVLFDCVPSKTLCTSAEAVTWMEAAPMLGLASTENPPRPSVNLSTVFARIIWLAEAQSRDIEKKLGVAGVRVIQGAARLTDARSVVVESDADDEHIAADVILVATGSSPRELPSAMPDGRRILNARQVYDLSDVPEHLIVVGSGATGAEFAHAFNRLGSQVTLVCSRDRVLPGEDPDAAVVLEEVFERRGMRILRNARAAGARATDDGVVVDLPGGGTLEGTHALFTVGQVPNSADVGLEAAGVTIAKDGSIPVDGVSRTNVPTIYAAGDVTGRMMLASTAAMQGRIAMWHALGQAVSPMRWEEVAATVFTDPEIATVGLSEAECADRGIQVDVRKLPFATNARAKMVGLEDGFVKVLATHSTHVVVGGTVVAPHASDLVLPLSLAVHARLSVEQLAQAFSIYPSFGGSIQEAARQLMRG